MSRRRSGRWRRGLFSRTCTNWSRKAAPRASATAGSRLLDLLRQVVGVAHLLDELELRLQPVGVILLAVEDVFQELARAVVAGGARRFDAGVEAHDRVLLHLQV